MIISRNIKDLVYFKIPVFIVDSVLNLLAMYLAFVIVEDIPDKFSERNIKMFHDMGPYMLAFMSYAISIAIWGVHLHERKIRPLPVFFRAFGQVITMELVFMFCLAAIYKMMVRTFFMYHFLLAITMIVIWHVVANRVVRLARQLGRNTYHVIIVGTDEVALRLYKELSYGQGVNGYRVNGFFSKYPEKVPEGAVYLGKVVDTMKYLEEANNVDQVFCLLSPTGDEYARKYINAMSEYCERHFIRFNYVPNMDGYPRRKMVFSDFGDVTIMQVRNEPMNNPIAKTLKRTADIIISGLFLCTVFPFVYIIVAIITKITSPGPVFFKQARTGYNGKNFICYKFRSMHVNKDSDKVQATSDDPRKTKFGDFLRRSSIDELPQFINVFKGDMSLIGPRPHMLHHTDVYSDLISGYMVRHLVKPGVTGWAQINGCRGETKTVDDMRRRVEHDIWYIENWSPMLDVEIFFRTISQVFFHKDEQAY